MRLISGLSGRLLLVTVLAVMLIEVAIFVPSVANFRVDYLQERVTRAHIAALGVLAAPPSGVPEGLAAEMLAGTEVMNIVLRRRGVRALVLSQPTVPPVAETYDLAEMAPPNLIYDALRRLALRESVTLRIVGVPPAAGGDVVEITLDSAPLRAAMLDYGLRILKLSLIISAITAAAVFVVIRGIVVSPLLRLIDALKRFQENPEDPGRIVPAPRGSSEMAVAARAVREMQEDVHRALRERARLASLGEALAKISHDLRNMLASLQLMVDRLERSSDPLVARVLPKIIGSLDRAITLCQRTLAYGKAEEAAPVIRRVALPRLCEEVAEGLGLSAEGGRVRMRAEMAAGATVAADPDHLYRVLANLARNAAEAIAAADRQGEICIAARSEGDWCVIEVRDTGPGLPEKAVRNLFRPFQGSVRKGGTGLGLAISRELVLAHGGELRLLTSTTEGTIFEIRLPHRP